MIMAQQAIMQAKESCNRIYDIETLDYEDVSIYTRGPIDNHSIHITSEMLANDAQGQQGNSPKRNNDTDQRKTTSGSKNTMLVSAKDLKLNGA